jgi:integrase
MRNDFTLFPRTIPSGKRVVYYYAYDTDGNRRGPWTTHCLNKTLARNYCNDLLRKGSLIPDRSKGITFAEYAIGFWERSSEYIKQQESRGDISDNYIANCRLITKNQIIPFFGDVVLDKITAKEINSWLLGFKERKTIIDGKEEIKQYKNTYANTAYGTFNVMLDEAVRRDLIQSNPCKKVKKLKNDTRNVEILTVAEVQKMFPAKNYLKIWERNEIGYIANRLASLTGMRIGEILGLKGEYVFEKHIYVCGQFGQFGYLPHTKTRENRNIPLMPEMIDLLNKQKKANGKGFVFSLDGGAKPVSDTYIREAFQYALNNIGINDKEIKRRGLTMHAWRHFLNTDLLRQGFSVKQVQGVTGHKSEHMTNRYNHLDAMQIANVVKAQEAIAGKKKTKKADKNKKTDLKVIKMPVRKLA